MSSWTTRNRRTGAFAVRRRWMGGVALAVATAVLTGCAPASTAPAPSPARTILGMFATEEEALAAAKTVLFKYRDAMDQIGTDAGASGYDALKPYATEHGLDLEIANYEAMRKYGYTVRGTTLYDSLRVAQLSQDGIDLAVCSDISGIRVLHGSDGDVTRADRVLRAPQLVHFVKTASGLLLNGFDQWSGENFCV